MLQEQLERGLLAEAEAGAARLLARAPAASRAESLVVHDATRILIEAKLRGGRHDDPALQDLVQSLLAISGALFRSGEIELAHAHQYAGFLARYQERPEQELEHFRRALEIVERRRPPDYSELAKALSNLANTHFRVGEVTRSRDLLEKALAAIDEHLPRRRWIFHRH